MTKRFSRLCVVGVSLALVGCGVAQYIQSEEITVDHSGISEDSSGQWAVSSSKEAAPPPAITSAPEPAKTGKAAKGNKAKKDASPALAVKSAKAAKGKGFELAVRRPERLPFAPGERTVMSITFMGVEAGTLDLRVLPYKYVGGRKSFHFRGHGVSTSVFALFYRVNDVGESFMDYDGLYSHKFQLKIDESRQQRDLVEYYDQKTHVIHYWEKLVHTKKGLRITEFTREIENYAQDAVTAAFYLRTLPLEVGESYTYPMVTNGKVWHVTAKVIRKEELATPMGKVPAIVIEPETRFEGAIKTTG